jgi:hypothetical protein
MIVRETGAGSHVSDVLPASLFVGTTTFAFAGESDTVRHLLMVNTDKNPRLTSVAVSNHAVYCYPMLSRYSMGRAS